MKFIMPRDWEAMTWFGMLIVELENAKHPHPREAATYIVFRLWTHLTYQLADHNLAGRFDRQSADVFDFQTKTLGLESVNIIETLVTVGVLEPTAYGWFCKFFAADNYWVGSGWLDGDEKRRILQRWREGRERAEKTSGSTAQAFSDERLWYAGQDMKRISPETMNSMILLVRSLDTICKMDERRPGEFTLGVMMAAHRIVSQYKPENLEAILRRIYYLSRQPRPDPRIPRDPEVIMVEFNRLVPVIMPEEIWSDWEKSK